MVKIYWRLSPLYGVLISFILGGFFCVGGYKNPFKTRSSPPPVISEGTWETPSDPKMVIQNLLYAYNEKIIVNFTQCLSDSFIFSAPEDSIDAVNQGRGDLFAQWDRPVEISVTSNIFSTARQNPDSFDIILSFQSAPPVPDDIGDSTAMLSRDYELLVIDLKAEPPETTKASGTATFYLNESSLFWWSIYFWSDIPQEVGKNDWGDFKALFR